MSAEAAALPNIEPTRAKGWSAHLPFIVPALGCVVLFTWMVSFGTGRLIADDVFGNFYDYQAQAWLHGRWDVPEPSLSGEAFVRDGKVYGYFGPTPALLRLPFVAAGLAFGETTRLWMLFHYSAALVAAYLLLLECSRQVRPRGGSAEACIAVSTWLTSAYVLTVGLGSTLFFLGSRAYVYHEAILCGANFALWSTWCAIKYLGTPQRRWAWLALMFGLLAIHARPPIGLFALTFVLAIAVRQVLRTRSAASLTVAGAAVLAIGSFNAVSYIKFRTIEGCPLRLNVQYTPEKLAALGNANFQLSNLRFNSAVYFFAPTVSVRREFPFVFLEFIDRKRYPESRMAYRDATLAIPYAMPSLTLLAFISFVLRRRCGAMVISIVDLLWLSAVPFALAMLTAVAVTQRYTADFCGLLIPAAAAGTAAISTLAGCARTIWRSATVALTLAGIMLQFAITIQHQRVVVWGVPESVRNEYRNWCRRIDTRLGNIGRAPD